MRHGVLFLHTSQEQNEQVDTGVGYHKHSALQVTSK